MLVLAPSLPTQLLSGVCFCASAPASLCFLSLAQEEKRREKEAEAAAAAAAEAAKQQQAAGASEAAGGGNSKGGKKKGSSRPPDPDPEGAKLAATTDPLGEATKFVAMLKQV